MHDKGTDAAGDLNGLHDLAAPVFLVTVVLLVFIGLSILWWPAAL